MRATLTIGDREIQPAAVMRVLGVFLDPWLHWKGHLDAVAGKMKTQLKALQCTTSSTWGPPLEQARQIYTMVIHPALSYGVLVWHTPDSSSHRTSDRLTGLAARLAPTQNKCLQVVAGTYQATPTTSLESETFVPPLDLYLDSLVAWAVHWLKSSNMACQIKQACTVVCQGLQCWHQNVQWPLEQVLHPVLMDKNWELCWTHHPRCSPRITDNTPFKATVARSTLVRWIDLWLHRVPVWGETHTWPPNK